MNITVSDEELDKIVIKSLTRDYEDCYNGIGDYGEVYRDDELMPQFKVVIFYYLNPDEQEEFNKRFPL